MRRSRQPAGIPVGGQFATEVKPGAGVSLADPWAPEPELRSQGLDARVGQLADEVSLACGMPPSVMVGRTSGEQRARDREYLDRLNAARGRLVEEYGSVEAACTHVGHQVAAQAEELAGITGTQVREAYLERLEEAEQQLVRAEEVHTRAEQDLQATMQPVLDEIEAEQDPQRKEILRGRARQMWDCPERARARELGQEVTRARQAKTDLLRGNDEQTQEDLRRLADGYAAAVGQVRQVGGVSMAWNEKSAKKARRAFDEAAGVFPADWIEASNNKVGEPSPYGGMLGRMQQAPLVKVSKRRAHYADARVHTTKRKEPDSTVSFGFGDKDMETYGRSSRAYVEYEELSEQDVREHHGRAGGSPGQTGYWRTSYEVARPFGHGPFDADTPPKGRGWEKWTSPEDPQRWAWRRKKHRMRTESSQTAPEITTNAEGTRVAGRSSTFAVSAHELSHRFEYTVDGITSLESQFLSRRTTDPVTGEQEPLRNLYPGSKPEYARKDHFVEAYMGKQYPDHRAHEVLSMGTDAIYGGRSGGLIGVAGREPDEDMRAFILGVHACAGRPVG